MTFRYGQRHEAEIRAARRIAEQAGTAEHRIADIDLRLFGGSALTDEIEGLENPTSESLAPWIWQHIQPSLPAISRIVVRETCTSGCIYEGHR